MESAGLDVNARNLRGVLAAVGVGEGPVRRTWFTRLVTAYLHYRARRGEAARRDGHEAELALRTIRRSCVKSAISGVASGLVTTGATIVAAEIPGPTALLVAIPAAALGVTAEMIARTLINLDMTCDLAAIFGVALDPDNPTGFWQLYSLAFATHPEPSDEEDLGRELVHHVQHAEAHQVGETIGHQLIGESLLKNLVPFLGVGISAVTNWRSTRALGDTVRRYMRYRRALHDAFARAEDMCRDHLDLLIEGLWFLFVADGKLVPEEAAILGELLRKLEPTLRAAVQERLVDDESDWLGRLPALAEDERDAFLYALQVAAAVDKAVSLPEQKILGRAAKRLGRSLEMEKVDRMIREFETVGVLRGA
jgi:hypothetical protein